MRAETIWSSLLDVTKNLTINKLWNRSFNQDHSAPWLCQGEWFLMDFQLSGIGGRMLKPLHIRPLKKHRNSANNALSQSIDWWCATISSSSQTSETLFIPLHWRALGSYCKSSYSESWSWLVLACLENYVKWKLWLSCVFLFLKVCVICVCYSDQILGYCCLNWWCVLSLLLMFRWISLMCFFPDHKYIYLCLFS